MRLEEEKIARKKAKQKYWDKKYNNAPIIDCACGCGKKTKSVDKYGRPKTYINGHNKRKYNDPLEYKRVYERTHKKQLYDNKKNYGKERKRKAINLMGGKCERCDLKFNGENEYIFDFHHLEEKEIALNQNGFNNYNWEIIKKELEKCLLLCANCHREWHHSNCYFLEKKENEIIECKCGCGGKLEKYSKTRKRRFYIDGHQRNSNKKNKNVKL